MCQLPTIPKPTSGIFPQPALFFTEQTAPELAVVLINTTFILNCILNKTKKFKMQGWDANKEKQASPYKYL